MRKYIYSLTALLTASFCSAQMAVSQAEYFWDTDPGEGNGTAITATDGSFNSAFERIAAYGLDAPGAGLHKFCVRVKDNQNAWSPVFTQIIRVEASNAPEALRLSNAEYFWDADPGEGNATPILASDGNFDSAFEKIAVYGLGAPGAGMHKFSVRVRDNQGIWSLAFTQIVNVEATTTPLPVSLAAAEYFWDTDPGEGNATAFTAGDGTFNSAYETMLQNNIPLAGAMGLHTFNVRARDNQGIWGPVFRNTVVFETLILGNADFAGSQVTVYPNPVRNILNLSSEKEITQVSVSSLLGQEVLAKTINANNVTLDFSNLATGTYLMRVEADGGMKTIKVIKQ